MLWNNSHGIRTSMGINDFRGSIEISMFVSDVKLSGGVFDDTDSYTLQCSKFRWENNWF